MIHELNKYEFEKAEEMKIEVICLHNISKVHSPYIVVWVCTQPNHKNNTFGDKVVKACVNTSKWMKTKPILPGA